MSIVAVVMPDRTGNRPLDYAVPPEWIGTVAAGTRVKISVRTRSVLGTVLEIKKQKGERALKFIEEVIGAKPLIKPKLLELAHWIADYYCAPLETTMACVLPQAVRSGAVKAKKMRCIKLIRTPAPGELTQIERKAPRQAEVIRWLTEQTSGMNDSRISSIGDGFYVVSEAAKETGVGDATFRALPKTGLVVIEMRDIGRDPHSGENFVPSHDLQLNADQ